MCGKCMCTFQILVLTLDNVWIQIMTDHHYIQLKELSHARKTARIRTGRRGH